MAALKMSRDSKYRPSLRHHHRIDANLPVQLRTQSGDVIDTHLGNLSRAGMMAVCTPEMIQLVLPAQESVSPHQPVPVDTTLFLKRQQGVEIRCDVIYVRRLSRDAFHLGMAFQDFGDDQQRQAVEDYVSEHLSEPPA